MFNVFLCIAVQHNWWLIVVASAVCISSTYATFFLYSRVPAIPAWQRSGWLAMTGMVAGSGIWTTHFAAMLAFETGLPTGYDTLPTLGSLGVAILSTWTGFALASSTGPRNTLKVVAGGLIVGLGITFMHYVGMAGFRTTGVIEWDPTYVLASVLIGAVFATAALFIVDTGANLGRQILCACLLSLGIVGMHFTGMTAVTIQPDASIVVPASMMSHSAMIVAAVAVTFFILVVSVGGVLLDSASRNGHLRRLREALDVMPEGLAFYDASDRLIAWNSQYEDLCHLSGIRPQFGMPYTDLLQSSIIHGAYPEAAGREEEWLLERNAARWGNTPSLIQRTISGRWLRITERRTADGGTVSVSVDVTDLKTAEEATGKARDKAEELARRAEVAEGIAGLGHWRVDALSREVSWSSQMYVIYGFAPNAPLDLEALMAMTHAEDAAVSSARLERQFVTGEADEGAVSLTLTLLCDGQVCGRVGAKKCVHYRSNGIDFHRMSFATRSGSTSVSR